MYVTSNLNNHNIIENFFENLSWRRRSENDLTDITWALCKSSESFQLLFLQFFFPDIKSLENITRFEREVQSKVGSRVDFLIENNEKLYLIECKINDTNQHFEQYVKDFGITNEQLGYITNYELTKKGFTIKTWEELYDHITNNLPENEIEKSLWTSYLKYLKSVCGIIKITKKMDLKGMYSLYSFSVLLKKLIKETEKDNDKDNNKDFKLQYIYLDTSNLGKSGCFFEVKYSEDKIKPTKAWIGVYYDREKPLICMKFENQKDWGKPVYEIIKNQLSQIEEDDFFTKPYYDDYDENVIWFDLKDDKHEEFDKTNLEGQKQIIKEFMYRVLMKPLELLNE